MSVAAGSGGIVTVLDLSGFSFAKVPPLHVLTDSLTALKLHYPYRLRAIYIIHAGPAFTFLWRIAKPLLSKRTKSKTIFLSDSEILPVLGENIGLDHLESAYGGRVVQGEINWDQYFKEY